MAAERLPTRPISLILLQGWEHITDQRGYSLTVIGTKILRLLLPPSVFLGLEIPTATAE